jgi:PAS domain S-box-containing protein
MITSYKKSTFRLLVTMILVSLSVTAVAVIVIFHITLQGKKTYLKKLSQSEYRIVLSFYKHTESKDRVLAILSEQQKMHPGLARSGELVISEQRGDSILLLHYEGIEKTGLPIVLSDKSKAGEPARHAAMKMKGFVKGTDFRGKTVLAYCEYIPELDWGLVSKIDNSEILKPFYNASLYAFAASIFLVLLGTYFFKRFSDPLYQRILESEEKYHTLFEFMPVGITITNKNGDILECNKESERLLGISKEEHTKRQVDSEQWKMVRPDYSPMPPEEFASTIALKENRLVTDIEMGILKGKNKVTWLNVSAAPFPLRDFGILVVYNDITQQVEAERKLRIRDKKLRENTRELKTLNDTKDKFFRILAHDLKNPFGSLLGASEYLYKEAEKHDANKVRKLGKILNASAKSGYDILSNLLEWSRSQTGMLEFHPERVDMDTIIDNNIKLVAALATTKQISIKADVEAGLTATADVNMLNTVIRNLLINALKYTDKGGEVLIGARKERQKVIVSVKDNGVGISAKDLKKIFRIDVKFVTRGTDNEKGTGLGLILCKEFIEKHGGNIWVESRKNVGSMFCFTLPK